MSKNLTITDCTGNRYEYRSTIFRGYHAIESANGVCVVEKRLFRQPATVSCYSNSCGTNVVVQRQDCVFCSAVNPTQRL